ncbi:induced myeloid leukemia cell differentiation protein Mcl-1b [Chanos chanos]|uniref:Induced myeloid leukemia cell differentiation protein Mcl-1b n=1 Tax=Chanos chanos TaxID=29144 RepID=A0A6J2WA79_CHACN|nr:induced myeloid leukemia cell differentiation protein Mcl-1 homolog [Chanos chanos]
MLLMPAQRTPTRPRLVCPLLPNKLLQFFDEETEPVASPSVVCLTQRVYKESGTGILNGVPRPTTPGTRTVYAQGLVSGSSPMFDREEKNKSCFSENELEEDTRRLICDFMEKYTDFSPSWTPKDKRLSTMKRVVDGLVVKHKIAYNGMITKLSLDERGNDMSIISGVARDLFSDGKTNWGRIASLLTFGVVVCQHLKDMGQKERVNLVAEEISSYLLSEQRTWLIDNNAWDGFEEFFHVVDPESAVRNALMTFVGIAGIGAGLALLIKS